MSKGLLKDLPPPPPGKNGWPWTTECDPSVFKEREDWPGISVIIPSFNCGKDITTAIRSLLLQNYPNLEIIIIDGGSKDNTLQIVKKYSPWISHWQSENDKGVYHAMNKGLIATGNDYVYFMGADDQIASPDVMYQFFHSISQKESTILYGNVRFKSSGMIYWGEFDYKKLIRNNICHQSMFYSKDIFLKLGGFNINYEISSDHHYNLACMAKGIKFKYINVIVANYNDGGLSSVNFDYDFHRDKLSYVMGLYANNIKEVLPQMEKEIYLQLVLFDFIKGWQYLTKLFWVTGGWGLFKLGIYLTWKRITARKEDREMMMELVFSLWNK